MGAVLGGGCERRGGIGGGGDCTAIVALILNIERILTLEAVLKRECEFATIKDCLNMAVQSTTVPSTTAQRTTVQSTTVQCSRYHCLKYQCSKYQLNVQSTAVQSTAVQSTAVQSTAVQSTTIV